MLLIPCPWCGPRDETEFDYGGEAHIVRPADPDALDDAEWADYLFMRANPKGRHRERWVHAAGCRRWFNLERDTVTQEIAGAYGMGEKAPARKARVRKVPARKAPARKAPARKTRARKTGGGKGAAKRSGGAR